MASPEELRALEQSVIAANPEPAPVETVELTRGAEKISVPMAERFDYVAKGYDTPETADPNAASNERGPMGFGAGALARAEALDRGATFGLGGLAGSVGSGIAAELAGYQGPRAAAPGVDAPVDEKSNFRQGFEQADLARKQRAEDLGLEGIAWEGAGGVAAALATGGGSLAARALSAAPAALAEKLGTKVAAKVIGEEAAAKALTYVAGRAAGGAVEAGIGAGISTATEVIPQALENPMEAAQDVLLGTAGGVVLGGALGGTFGLVEGVSRAAGKTVPAIEAAVAPTPAVPAARAVALPDAVAANSARPMLSAQLPDPPRSTAKRLLDQHRALTGGAEEAIEEGTRTIRGGMDRLTRIAEEMDLEAGIAQKQIVNDAAMRNGFSAQLTDAVDERDAERLLSAAEVRKAAEESAATLAAARAAADAAREAETAARAALDIADVPGIRKAPKMVDGPVDVSDIVPNPKFSRDLGNGVRADTFDLPGKGTVQIDSGDLPGFATIAKIQVDPSMGRQGIGTRLYAKADEFARSKGLKLASDVERAPAAESWWKKQVAAGRAEFDAGKNRYILNEPLQAPTVGSVDKLGRPGSKVLAPMRDALRGASVEAKRAAAELARLESEHAAKQAAAATLEDFVPRKLTVIEREARDMFSGLLSSVDTFAKGVAGPDEAMALQLRKQLLRHRDIAYEAMRQGDYGSAYSAMDQGLKHALRDFTNAAKSGAAETFGMGLYDVPKSFLENRNVWADVAERQALANPNYSAAIVAGRDASYRGLFQEAGVGAAKEWGTSKAANSASVKAALSNLGGAGGESVEAGTRRALRAQIADFDTRSQAWGTPRAKLLAEEAARVQTHLEDVMDSTALRLRDAATGKDALASATSLATVGALAGAVTGTPAIGIPFVAARWLLGSVAKYRGDLGAKIAKGTTRLLQAGERGGKRVGQLSTRGVGLRISSKERQESLAEARELTDITSKKFGALALEAEATNAVSPGLGDALLKQKLTAAQLIQSHLPKAPSTAMFSPQPRLTSAAATQLDRLISATRAPAKTFERIYDGKATAEDLDAMRKIYPDAYKKMVDQILDTVSRQPERQSASSKMYLSRVVGQPLTPALMRLAESQKRAQAATAGVEEAGAATTDGDNGSDGKTFRAKMSLDADDVYGSRADRVMTE